MTAPGTVRITGIFCYAEHITKEMRSMPAAFAHDLFGRKVYMEADPVVKRIIKKERYCFLLGVHGPDILFFYKALGKNKVNQKGVRMHGEPAA